MLRALLEGLLAPYPAYSDDRIQIAGGEVPVEDHCATPLALLVHELATNAAKYGSLSNAEGRVVLDIAVVGERLSLTWQEHGGPPISGTPGTIGFGTMLTEVSVAQQLGGQIEREWLPGGLKVRAIVPMGSLTRA